MTKKKHGGKRPNSGRKPSKYKTTTVSVRVRIEWVDTIKKAISNKINELKNKEI